MEDLKMEDQMRPGLSVSKTRILLTVILTVFSWCPATASSLNIPQDIRIHGAIISDFFQNHNTDDNFAHYAAATGSDFTSIINESRFCVSGSLGKCNGTKTTFEASFDLMGENDFEIVTAWIRVEKGNWYLLVGKTENLVATGETTLNYDGFYSSGGIQTGTKANQNQVQIGYQLKKHFTLAFSVTNEPAQNGSLDRQLFSSDRPSMEGALFFDFGWGNGKIAVHTGDMKLDSHAHFHPAAIMAEVNIPLTKSISWLISGFRAKAGSQFFTTDILFDCAQVQDGYVHEISATGGLTELVFERDKWQAWAGFGIFSLNNDSLNHLRIHQPIDILTENRRFSVGTLYDFSGHLHAGLELTQYKTTHLSDTETHNIRAISVQLQFSITF